MREIRSKAILYAFDKAGLVVYSQILELGAYYDGQHLWDSWERIKAAGIVRLVGTLFDSDGNLSQEFENTYDEATGSLTGTRAFHAREHLKTDERMQKNLAAFARLREQKSTPES
jgi:hypothetical protein